MTAGLDAQMIANSDIKESLESPVAWQTLNSGGGEASIGVDGSRAAQHGQSPEPRGCRSRASQPAASVGVANVGYSGIPVEPSTSYQVSFFAKSDRLTTPVR